MRPLNNLENKWINKLLSVDFKGKNIIQKQLENSSVILNEEYSYISLMFCPNSKTDIFPFNIRVPVEMRVFQGDSAPIVFLLHIINGYINELEILTADSSKIEIDSICLDKADYEINRELILE